MVGAFGLLVETGGGFERVGVPVSALGLELTELGGIFFATAMEARFLEVQIAELLFVGEEDLELDESGADGGVLVIELLSELGTALGVNGHFQSGDAAETPGGIGDGLNQVAFALAAGTELLFVIANVLLIGRGIVTVKEDGAAGEACFDCVEGGFGLAF